MAQNYAEKVAENLFNYLASFNQVSRLANSLIIRVLGSASGAGWYAFGASELHDALDGQIQAEIRARPQLHLQDAELS